jgi:hypothetical protein
MTYDPSMKPNIGDKVRVTAEGVIKREAPTSAYIGKTRLMVEDPAGKTRILYWPPVEGTTIEVIEPAYVEGAVYLDADGDLFVYKGAEIGLFIVDRHSGRESTVEDDYPTRPVLRIGG